MRIHKLFCLLFIIGIIFYGVAIVDTGLCLTYSKGSSSCFSSIPDVIELIPKVIISP